MSPGSSDTTRRIELRLPPELADQLDALKPRTQTLPSFCALLIEEKLAACGTLGGPSEAGTPSNTLTSSLTSSLIDRYVVNSITTEEEVKEEAPRKRRQRKPRAQGTPEFEAFWKQYLAIALRANGQTKPAAVQAWVEASKEATAEQLLRALTAAVNEQAKHLKQHGWASPFPDCHRWLSKGYWQQHLDTTVTAPGVDGPGWEPNPEDPSLPF